MFCDVMGKSILAIALVLSCSLDRSVLAPYNKASATQKEWAASRRAISKFMGCAPSTIDDASRRVFVEVVRREFTTDHRRELDEWHARRPDSEALFEGITVFRYELRAYYDLLYATPK